MDKRLEKEMEYVQFHKDIIEVEIKNVLAENYKLAFQTSEIGSTPEFIKAHLNEFKEYLESIKHGLIDNKNGHSEDDSKFKFNKIIDKIIQPESNINSENTTEAENVKSSAFFNLLITDYPNLTKQELKLALLIVNGFSDFDNLNLMNITKEQMKGIRYRLRKKLGLTKETDIKTFLESLGQS